MIKTHGTIKRIFNHYSNIFLNLLKEKEMKFSDKLEQVKGKLFINGQFVESRGGKLFDVINPADETVICQTVAATPEDVDFAVESARTAFDDGEWRKMDDYQRGKLIYKLADLIEQNTEWLAYFESLNNGKPLSLATN